MKRLSMLTLAVVLASGCLGPLGLPSPVLSIEPASPGPDDDLVLVLEEVPTGDGRPTVTFQIEWQQDGVTVEDLAGAELVPSSWTSTGETWTAIVAAAQGDQVGPTGEASVVLGETGDDDDTTSGDDDDTVSPGAPGTAGRLCSAAGTVSNDVYTVTTCTGPVEAAPGVMSNSVYVVRINKLSAMTK